MEYKMLRYWVFVLLAWAISFGATAGEDARVRVGLAWQPNAAAYERVVLSIEAAGGEAVILPQLCPAGFDYDNGKIGVKYVDEFGDSYFIHSKDNRRLRAILRRRCEENGIMHKPDDIFSYLHEFPEKSVQSKLL